MFIIKIENEHVNENISEYYLIIVLGTDLK